MSHEFGGITPEVNETATQAAITMWEGRKVALLIPCYRGALNIKTHVTLFANYAAYGPSRIAIPEPVEGTVIQEARNILIHRAMPMKDVETFIMLDDDMVLPCGSEAYFNGNLKAGVRPESARLNAISRIMSHGRDKEIIAGLYFGRHEFGQAQCESGFNSAWRYNNDEFRRGAHQGLKAEGWVATGFIKIERTALDKMRAAIDGGKFPECKPNAGQDWYGYFQPLRVGIGEDVSFGLRMKEIGVQSYLDASLVCLHADGNTLYGPKNTRNRPQ